MRRTVRGIPKLLAAFAAAAVLATATAALGAGGSPGRVDRPNVDLSRAKFCNFIGQQKGSLCLLPFPDNYYTVRDRSTATRVRINLKTPAMPANADGDHIDAPPYNRNDGFSPGQTIIVRVP